MILNICFILSVDILDYGILILYLQPEKECREYEGSAGDNRGPGVLYSPHRGRREQTGKIKQGKNRTHKHIHGDEKLWLMH